MTTAVASGSASVQLNFSIASSLSGSNSDAITLVFPNSLISSAVSNACFIQFPVLYGSWSSSFVSNTFIISLYGNSLLMPGAVTVTCSGLTTLPRAASLASTTGGVQITTSKDSISARLDTPCVGCTIAPFIPAVFGARFNFYYRSTASLVTLNFAAALNFKIRVFVDHGSTASLINWGSEASSQLRFPSLAGSLHSFFVEYVAAAGTASCPIIASFDFTSIFWPEAISQSPFMLSPA